MRINIKATGIELTPEVFEYVEKRLVSLGKFFASAPHAVMEVEVGKSTQHHRSGAVFRAEVHVSGQGLDAHAASEQEDVRQAIDAVRDEMARKLTHEKGKREALYRRGARAVKEMMRGWNPFKKRP